MTSLPRRALVELADPELDWRSFERFSLELVQQLPGVVDAYTHGVHGEGQGGIDLHVNLDDGRVRAVQCRHVQKNFGKHDAERLVGSAAYPADEYWLWCTSELTTGARAVFDQHPKWTTAWGITSISGAIRNIDRERARWLVEDYLGASARKRFLGPEGELAVVPADRWFLHQDERRQTRLRTDQTLRGRANLLTQVRAAIDDQLVEVVLLTGRGGVGKTRLLRAIADDLQPGRRVIWLRDGIDVVGTLADELPGAPFILLIDDAHRRVDLPSVLATVLDRDVEAKVIVATRPHRTSGLRADLHDAGVATTAIVEPAALTSLTVGEARDLATECLDDGHQSAADALAELTRDVPALCVLGARLINDGDMNVAELAHHEQARYDILARFREELVGAISDRVDRALLARLMARVAALQPLALGSAMVQARLAQDLNVDEQDVPRAIDALESAGLLSGIARRRIAPDVLGDHILHDECVDREGRPTGYADELLDTVPDGLLSNVLANLAELDWRLGVAGGGSVLDNVKHQLSRTLVESAAWDREQHLKALEPAAVYVADWIVDLARDLLDHPAATQALFVDMEIEDSSARQALGSVLGNAAHNINYTEAALCLLWEASRDLPPRSPLVGSDAQSVLQAFGSYQAPPELQAIYLTCVMQFLDDHDVEDHRVLPVSLLRPLIAREGTTTRWQRHAVAMSSYTVNAAAVEPTRARVRQSLAEQCLSGGPRTRVGAATLIADMLRQPFGFFGTRVGADEIRQWRPEQLALLDEIERVLGASGDPLVRRVLRDGLSWHADYSTIYGVKSRVRRIQDAYPADNDELLLRAISHGLDEANYALTLTKIRSINAAIIEETPDPRAVLDRVDGLLDRIQRCDPERHTDVGPVMATLAEGDPDWGMQAAQILATEPERPTALGAGVLLERVGEQRPDSARAIVAELCVSADVRLRRIAANYVGRALSWSSYADGNERRAAIGLASDLDVAVAERIAQIAHHVAERDPELSREIVLAIRRVDDRRVSEAVCMTLKHLGGLSDDDEDKLLDGLATTPVVDHWLRTYINELFGRRPTRALEYIVARLDRGRIDGYEPLPFDGLNGDLLAARADYRAGLLDRLLTVAIDHELYVRPDVAQLYWDMAGAGEEGHLLIADGIVKGPEARRELALEVLEAAASFRVLNFPDWVAIVLDQCPASARDRLRQALLVAAESGSRHGRPGEPFPQDIALRDQAQKNAAASRAGSRGERLWKDVVAYAEWRIADVHDLPEDDEE
jgi:hypothetical protein